MAFSYTGLDPSTGGSGTLITITGSGFSSTTPSHFLMFVVALFYPGSPTPYFFVPPGTPSSSSNPTYTIVNDTTITFIAAAGPPPHSGDTGAVVAQIAAWEQHTPDAGNPVGSSTFVASFPFTYYVSSSDSGGGGGGGGGGLPAPPVPQVTSVSPNFGPMAGGALCVISGSGFTDASQIHFGPYTVYGFQVPTAFTVDSDFQITVQQTPVAFTPGPVDVQVEGPGGVSPININDRYTFAPPPSVTRLDLNHDTLAGGKVVSVTGTGFKGGVTSVLFGTKPALQWKVYSDLYMTVIDPPMELSGPVDVRVVTKYGMSLTGSGDVFTYGVTLDGVDLYRAPISSRYGMDGRAVNDPGKGFNNFIRIAAMLPAHGSWTYYDYTVGGSILYEYYAAAVTAEAVETDSIHKQGQIEFTVLWLHDILDPLGTCHPYLFTPGERSDELDVEVSFASYAGRERPVAEFGTATARKVKIALALRQKDPDYQLLSQLVRNHATVCYRDSRGRRVFGVAFQLAESDNLMAYETTIELDEVDFEEAI